MWDLQRLEEDGQAAQGLLKRHYLLLPAPNGSLTAIGVVNEEQRIEQPSSLSHHFLASETQEGEEPRLCNLEMKMALDSIPKASLEEARLENGLNAAFEAVVSTSSSSTRHSFI